MAELVLDLAIDWTLAEDHSCGMIVANRFPNTLEVNRMDIASLALVLVSLLALAGAAAAVAGSDSRDLGSDTGWGAPVIRRVRLLERL